MAFADSIKPLLRSVRAIPGQFGLRKHRVYLRTRTGAYEFGQNNETTETELVEGDNQPPKVEQLGDEALALNQLAQGSLRIGPITTPDGLIGLSEDAVKGAGLQDYETLAVRVVGPMGDSLYSIKSRKMDKAMHWILTVEPLSETPPE